MSKDEEKRRHRCCFTGHRPEKLLCNEEQLRVALRNAILIAYADGFTTFISGMARGVDILAAKLVIEIRKERSDIHLICALPYPHSYAYWKNEWQIRYQSVLQQADYQKIICPSYSMNCYQYRNEWMVDHATRVIAVYHGQPSGTQKTISYARRQGVEIQMICQP